MGQRHLRQFLGMTNQLHKFISNFSEKTAPLRELLRNDAHWSWEPAQQQAFDTLKADISQPPVLRYFDPSKPVTLSANASKSGLSAVCLQDGFPVAYASRAITEAEIRKSRRNCFLPHLHGENSMILSAVGKLLTRPITSLSQHS